MAEIRENALFIADSHYPHHGNAFLQLLKQIDKGTLSPSQLFLMGDNFDLLFGYNDYIQTFSQEAVTLLHKLSKKVEIHYFEGNHDFCLSEIFTNINIYPREQQPVYFTLGKKRVGMSHGDKFVTGAGYDLYCTLLRNPVMLTLLKPLQKLIINHRMKVLSSKNICRAFEGFEKRAEAIVKHYDDADLVIEGHFHQARTIGSYISLPSLACQNEVAVVRNGKIVFVRVDELF